MPEMSHRQRVMAALSHQEPDRVPIDLGSTRCTSIHVEGYQQLKRHFGVDGPDVIIDRMMSPVLVDERILQALDVDTRGVFTWGPDRGGSVELPAGYSDEWGLVRRKPVGSHYYDLESSPLAGEISLQDIVRFPRPDPTDPGRFRGLLARIEELRRTTDCAIVLNLSSGFVHISQYLRGFEDWFVDMASDQRLAGALLDHIVEVSMEVTRRALEIAGDKVDVVFTGDDLGHHSRPLVSPATYRSVIKPRQKRLFDLVKSLTKAKVLYHTCGSVYLLLEDLIELGIDAINPVQTTAKNMEPTRLKRDFGDRMCFWGGIDTHRVLPRGTTEEVRAEVERCIAELGPGGGYVVNAVHNIQPDVPLENTLAMFEHARAVGSYPLLGAGLGSGDQRVLQ